MRKMHKLLPGVFLIILLISTSGISQLRGGGLNTTPSRGAGFIVFGDVSVAGAEDKPLTFTVLLYTRTGNIVDRQRVGSKGRYQFTNVALGDYDIAVEFENTEVWREHIKLTGMLSRFQKDIGLEFRSGTPAGNKAAAVSAEDSYDRKGPNRNRFEKAQESLDQKEYDKAAGLFMQIVTDDPQDYQAWSELGTAYLLQNNLAEAEKAYVKAAEVKPTFFRALLNLGKLRLRQKNFEGAITVLDQAVTAQPTSAEANYLLGDAYLEIKKGSKGVVYLNEALKLDPAGMADAHLLLARLYNGANMKSKAAAEYEEFLKQKPDYADRKKLEAYINANKAPAP